MQQLQMEYFTLMSRQGINPEHLDYGVVEKHRSFLEQLAQVENCGVTVFDLCRFEHVFASYNFSSLFGYDMDAIATQGNEYFDSRIHPEDRLVLMRNGIDMFKFFFSVPKEERTHYKAINEYRILNREERYIRVIEQHQALEQDPAGNIWLALGVIDISPNQDPDAGMTSRIVNFRTGTVAFPVQNDPEAQLTRRETEVLRMIKDGKLSKEISDQMSISVHTVNTHRQRILRKLNASNSMEAVRYATDLGLLGGFG